MLGKLREVKPLQAPYINVKVKVVNPGITNGKPNIQEDTRCVLSPSAKKIGTYIRNQLFGSDLLTQTEGLDINWLTPTLGEALELAVYEEESFIYIHKFNKKVYLECIKKNQVHNLVQRFDKIMSCDLVQDFEGADYDYSLERHIELKDGNTELTFKAYRKEKKTNKWLPISIEQFNSANYTNYKRFYRLPYEVLVNIDVGQNFFKDSVKFLEEEMKIYNTLCEEVEKTKTRIATTQHYQSGDIYSKWQPNNLYNVQTLSVGEMEDYFTLLPGDREHAVFQFLQGDLRVNEYVDAFKFCDYQVIQMANLSPATFGYEKDNYQNVASVDLSADLTDMTIEAIKKQIEPQVNNLIVNIIKLQEELGIEGNEKIPEELIWDYGTNENITDDKKVKTLQAILRTMSVPYSTRSKIITPILNKLIDEDIDSESLINEWKQEKEDLKIEYEEI